MRNYKNEATDKKTLKQSIMASIVDDIKPRKVLEAFKMWYYRRLLNIS